MRDTASAAHDIGAARRAAAAGAARALYRLPKGMLLGVLLAALAVGCSEADTRTITLVRVASEAAPSCGAPDDGRSLIVRALGDFPSDESTARAAVVAAGVRLDIDSFPVATQALSLEVLGAGGAVRAVGRSAPLLGGIDALADGAELPVFMAPLGGACATGPPLAARVRPLLARSGAGAVVVGGVSLAGEPVHTVEYYDPASASFSLLAERLYGTDALGLTGASATGLPDGRVLIAGGPASAYQIYDPASGFSPALFLDPGRAYHAAVAIGPSQVLLAGGCGALAADARCTADSALRTSSIVDLDAGTVRAGPALAQRRIGGSAALVGGGAVLLSGGVDLDGAPLTTAERVFLDGSRTSEVIVGTAAVGASAARLLSGSVLTGFAPAGAESAATVAVLTPTGASPRALADAPVAVAGATLTALEDGSALALVGGQALRYEPVSGRFRVLDGLNLELAAPAAEGEGGLPAAEHAAALLDDGSVLVVGGRPSNESDVGDGAQAWIVRPGLDGPLDGEVAVSFGSPELAALAVASDPGRGALVADAAVPHYLLSASASTALPSEWLIAAGPQFGRVDIETRVRIDDGGVAVLFGFRDAAEHFALVLLPGQRASLFALAGGTARAVTACTAETVAQDDLRDGDDAVGLAVRVDDARVRASIGARTLIECEGFDAAPRGYVGVGVVGSAGAGLRIDTLSARRLP